jgi:hypothetical protein
MLLVSMILTVNLANFTVRKEQEYTNSPRVLHAMSLLHLRTGAKPPRAGYPEAGQSELVVTSIQMR